jgi:cell division protein FtsA
MKKKSPFICGLDVGTSKICMVIVREHYDGALEFISSGHAESRGLEKGVVVNLNDAASAIRMAADEAEKKAGISVESVRLGAGGDHFQGLNSRGAVTVAGDRHEVTSKLEAQVIAASQSIVIPDDHEIRHVLTQEFFLDGKGGIKKPVGLFGSQLDVNVHIITCRSAPIQNLINAVNRAEMRVRNVIAQPLAAAESVLTSDEKERGVAMIDIGGGSTGITVSKENAVRFTKILPVGGHNFTRDLNIILRTPIDSAEHIKKTSGTVLAERVEAQNTVTVPGMGDREPQSVAQKNVCDILNARAMDLMRLISGELRRAAAEGSWSPLIAGVVITGGGSMLDGMMELAEKVLNTSVRRGLPMGIRGLTGELLHPEYSAAFGLTQFGSEDFLLSPQPKGLFNRIWSLME